MNKNEFLEALNEEGILIYATTWESNFERLKELKKYKEMWKELEVFEPGKIFEVPEEYLAIEGGVMQYIIKTIKEKYFPQIEEKKLIRKRLKELREVVAELMKALHV